MKKTLSFILILSFITGLFAEGGIEFSGDLETRWGAGAPWTDSDSSAGRFLIGDTSFTGKLDAYYDNSSAFAEGAVSYDAVTNTFDWSLDELWLDYSSSFWGIRIGRQKTAWGKADGIDITNVICPSDMSSFSAMTSDDSKLAVDAIRLSVTGNQFTADAYWIPFFTPSALPLEEVNTQEPEKAIWNGEYGLKVSGYFSALDVSLYGFYGWDDTPFLDYSISYSEPTATMPYPLPNGLNISGEYKRMAMLGADAAIPIKETVLRAEAAFFPQCHFQKTEGNSEQHDELSALLGLDWMPSGWTLTAQYYCDYIFGDIETLERKDVYQHGATLSISKTLLNETLELSLAGVVNFNAFDSLINPSLSYNLSDQINLETGAYILLPGPDEDGTYGAYKDYSTIYINVKFSM